MKLTRLDVANLRAFDQATFNFDPRFTLLVGINGVGKTSVLEALRISLSRLLPQFTASRSRPDSFSLDDIQIGASALTVDVTFTVADADYQLLIHKQREQYVPDRPGEVRHQTMDTPDRETLTPALSQSAKELQTGKTQPIGLYFSTRRSLVSNELPKTGRAGGGQSTAFADALSDRPLRLAELALWMQAQEALAGELPRAGLRLDAMRAAAQRFLPDCQGLRAEGSDPPRLLVEKRGQTLDVRQLSDGERSSLALVLDLARRLSQANVGLDDPVRDGSGIVLIDEIDLHLHPRWQRKVVKNLIETFPACQFVATTHSPQVIGEVSNEKIRIIDDGKVYTPPHSFGVDSSRVLEEVMDTPPRNREVEEEISRIAELVENGKRDEAAEAIEALEVKIGADDPELTRARTLLEFLEEDG